MKSLSILVLLGIASAILLGAFLVVTPVLANAKIAASSSSIETNLNAAQPFAVSGSVAETAAIEAAPAVDDLAVVPAAFTVRIKKDTASAQAAQEAALQAQAEAAEKQARFDSFVQSVSNGKANQVTGIYVEDVLANSVVRQPSDNASFVSTDPNEVTQFGLAAQYGSQAFLAHNYLAGAVFTTLTEGQIITLVYGDGSSQQFRIENIMRYQALSPNSTQSRFVDLESGEQLSASTLFHSVYNSDNPVVLQTCIAQDGVSSWGRLFITAVPLS